MSQIKVNTINDANGGSNAVLYGVAAPVNSMGFRNRIINGDMRIDQRNAGVAVTAANAYTLDRWLAFSSVASKYTVIRGATNLPAGFSNALNNVSSSAYSVAAGDFFMLTHRIEGFNIADLGWGTASAQDVTLSFWVYTSLTGTFGGAIINSAQTRSYPFTYSVPVANTLTKITVIIPGDTTGTWLTNNGVGMGINFGLGVGTTYSGTAGAWSSTTYYSATGAVSVVGTNGAIFNITGVQLEAGSVASPFERRDYGRELMMCQRYYETRSFFTTGYGATGGNIDTDVPWIVSKRAAPLFAFGGISYSNASGATTVAVQQDRVIVRFTVTTLGSATINTSWTASAEL